MTTLYTRQINQNLNIGQCNQLLQYVKWGSFSGKVKKKNMEDLMKKDFKEESNVSMAVRGNDMKTATVVSHLKNMIK